MKRLLRVLTVAFYFFVAGCGTESAGRPAKTSDTKLWEMIGKNISEDTIQDFLRTIGVAPEIMRFDDPNDRLRFNDCFFYSFKSKGISLCPLKASIKVWRIRAKASTV